MTVFRQGMHAVQHILLVELCLVFGGVSSRYRLRPLGACLSVGQAAAK